MLSMMVVQRLLVVMCSVVFISMLSAHENCWFCLRSGLWDIYSVRYDLDGHFNLVTISFGATFLSKHKLMVSRSRLSSNMMDLNLDVYVLNTPLVFSS